LQHRVGNTYIVGNFPGYGHAGLRGGWSTPACLPGSRRPIAASALSLPALSSGCARVSTTSSPAATLSGRRLLTYDKRNQYRNSQYHKQKMFLDTRHAEPH
jgi:hypothetical protein